MNKHIKFIIFNESFWSKGLIYSQNFLPLIKLSKDKSFKGEIQILIFVSFLDLFLFRKEIETFIKEFEIKIKLYPILFVRSRFFILRWFMFPLLFLTTIPYMLYFSTKDLLSSVKGIVYHMRAYTTSFLFTTFYFGNANLIFDPRSDFILENRRLNYWKKNSFTDRLWLKIEKKIINKSYKSIFISKPHLEDTLKRSNFNFDPNQHVVFPNPIDFSHFKNSFNTTRNEKELIFLYTGSLGNWNNLNTYLTFFKNIKKIDLNAKLYVITSTRKSKIDHIINNSKYENIIKDVNFIYNVPYDGLPELYSRCDVGLQLMEQQDSRIGVKYVEYLAAGLIPVVNSNVRGASEYCNENNLGLVIEDHDIDFNNFILKLKEIKQNDFKTLVLQNKYIFDVDQAYTKLINIYG